MADIQFEHKTAQQLHANRRARERLGVHFNRHEARIIIDRIKAGKLSVKGFGERGTRWYKTDVAGAVGWVCYDGNTNRIVTVLHVEPWQVTVYRRRNEAIAEAARVANEQRRRELEAKAEEMRIANEQILKAAAEKKAISQVNRARQQQWDAMGPAERLAHRQAKVKTWAEKQLAWTLLMISEGNIERILA